MISLKHALERMRAKDDRGRFVPFDVSFVSIQTGELVDYRGVTLPQRDRVELQTMEQADKVPTRKKYHKTTVTLKKSEQEFRQCHIHLITRFNGERVI